MAQAASLRNDQAVPRRHDIPLTLSNHTVNQAWVRFGTREEGAGIYTWHITTGPFQPKPGTPQKRLMSIYDSQLPAPVDRCYYQVLCEVTDDHADHAEPELLMTEPLLLIEADTAVSSAAKP